MIDSKYATISIWVRFLASAYPIEISALHCVFIFDMNNLTLLRMPEAHELTKHLVMMFLFGGATEMIHLSNIMESFCLPATSQSMDAWITRSSRERNVHNTSIISLSVYETTVLIISVVSVSYVCLDMDREPYLIICAKP